MQFRSYFITLDISRHFNVIMHHVKGHALAQLVKALRYKPEGCGFDSR